MTAFERQFPPDPAELPPARAALRAWLKDVGVDGDDATSDVLVVTSELVTNGVFHDGGDLITLRAARQKTAVSIEVTTVDHLPGRHPTYRDVEDSAEGGRGLAIVHALSHGYTVHRQDNERVTACRVTTSEQKSPLNAPPTCTPNLALRRHPVAPDPPPRAKPHGPHEREPQLPRR